jgi:transposase
MLAMCSGVYRLSRRTVEGLMSDFFNVDISLGSVSACEGTVSDAVAVSVAEARTYVESAPVVHADETGYRQSHAEGERSRRAWLWTAVTPLVTVFLVHAKRSTAAAKELLGLFPGALVPDVGPARCAGAGVLVSDRWSAYNFIDAARRQLCWAHLLRDFEWIAEFGAEALGKALVDETKLMFRWWHELRERGLARSGFQAGRVGVRLWSDAPRRERMASLMKRIEALLEEGAMCDHKKTAGKCRKILELRVALWTFVPGASAPDQRRAVTRPENRGRGADPSATRRSGHCGRR